MDSKKLNIIFLGNFPYPKGMAGTKRIQHAINALKSNPSITIHVIVLSQSGQKNNLSGTYEGVSYETMMINLVRFKLLLLFPVLNIKAIIALKRSMTPRSQNILYKYGPPSIDDVCILYASRLMGYKVVFDIVEDYDLAWNISKSVFHRLKMTSIFFLSKHIKSLASGVIVISSHLQNKYKKLLQEQLPIHYRPISIDLKQYPATPQVMKRKLTLFYSGSFGKKDGIPVLLDAFDIVASKFNQINLVMTGKSGTKEKQDTILRIAASPYKDRIHFLGYLDDDAYYNALNNADIPCMTRINTGYANAGFPFKLGEFLATGKPVVASNISDVGQLLKNSQEAMLVIPGSSSSIAIAIEFLINNPNVASSIGKKGREKAKKLFDYRTQGESLLDFLHSLYR